MNKQQIIDEVLEEFRQKLDKAYNDTPDLKGTQVELIDSDLETVVYPVECFYPGTVLNCGGWEAFCITNEELERRWVTINGEQYSDEQFANLIRRCGAKVAVIHWGM